MSDHPDRIQLTAFLDGRPSEDDRIVIEDHVESCEVCCQAMSELPSDTLSGRLLDVDTNAKEPTFAFPSQQAASKNDSEIPPALRDHPRYRILGPLGKGGMGVVYKAQHRMMDREVALKVIDGRFIENPQAIERFRTEVKAAARLTHANIVRAYDAEQADNLHFLVMEFVDGISLAELIRRNGPLPVHQVCGVVRKVAQGLQHAFEQGMVHRDIKPQNIMVTQDGRIRILDFGLAKLAREREAPVVPNGDASRDQMRRTADALTLVGSVLGTPDYIAPEQAVDARQADIRADIYSLGCTCYFLLTGLPPYPTGTVMEKLTAHTECTPTSIVRLRPEVPAKIIAITQRMMERQPQDRYQTPREIAQAMDEFVKTGSMSPAATTDVDHAAVATLSIDRSPFSDSDLLKVDLDAISINSSAMLSLVDLAATPTVEAPAEPRPAPPVKPKTPPMAARATGRSARRAPREIRHRLEVGDVDSGFSWSNSCDWPVAVSIDSHRSGCVDSTWRNRTHHTRYGAAAGSGARTRGRNSHGGMD
jgi:eukaryotic-like serine/threonine-protein kinase